MNWIGLLIGVITILAFLSFLLRLAKSGVPHDRQTPDPELLLSLITRNFKVSEYAVFEAECASKYGAVHESYVDNGYDHYLKEGKVSPDLHAFMVDVAEGRKPLDDKLAV